LLSFWVQIFIIESGRDISHEDVLERKEKKKKMTYAKKGSFYTHTRMCTVVYLNTPHTVLRGKVS